MIGRLIKNIITFFRYITVLLIHKWVVFVSGLYLNSQLRGTKFKISHLRLLRHDNSKFSYIEFWPYARHYYGDKGDDEGFNRAWTRHFRVNDHHWEYYVHNYIPGVTTAEQSMAIAKEMNEQAMLEMVCDWIAATFAYQGLFPVPGKWPWAQRADSHIGMNRESRAWFYGVLSTLGFEKDLERFYDISSTIEDRSYSEKLRDDLVILQNKKTSLKFVNIKYYFIKVTTISLFLVLISYKLIRYII
jgi:hypothetical protein